jgi:hypothetical protein
MLEEEIGISPLPEPKKSACTSVTAFACLVSQNAEEAAGNELALAHKVSSTALLLREYCHYQLENSKYCKKGSP